MADSSTGQPDDSYLRSQRHGRSTTPAASPHGRQLIRVNENAGSLFEILLDRARSQGTAMKPRSQDFEAVKRALRRIPHVIRVG